MSEELRHLNRIYAEEHSKYVYFLLAATGAALGYALQKLDSATYNPLVWFGLVSIASWLLSFLFGCKHLIAIKVAIFCNYELLKLDRSVHSHKLFEVTYAAIQSSNEKANSFFNWQFRLLAFGVVTFTAWRVALLFYVPGTAP
jgi:hypothetical protein